MLDLKFLESNRIGWITERLPIVLCVMLVFFIVLSIYTFIKVLIEVYNSMYKNQLWVLMLHSMKTSIFMIGCGIGVAIAAGLELFALYIIANGIVDVVELIG